MNQKSKEETQFYEFDNNGGVSEFSEKELYLSKGLVWVILDYSQVEYFFKKHLPETPEFIYNLMSAMETRPRIISYKDSLLATFRGVNLDKESSPEDMISVRLWIQHNLIITVQRRRLINTQNMLQNLKLGVGAQNIADFLEELLISLADTSSDAVTDLDNSIDLIEDHIFEKNMTYDYSKLNILRRRIVIMRRYLVPQRDAINRIPINKLSWLNETNSIYLHEVSESCTRVVEDLGAAHERATIIHEESFSRLQSNMNYKMYLLSIVTLIFMPLSFITGLLGINVGGIPGINFKYSFMLVCVFIFIIFCCQLFFLKRKKWF